MIGAFTVGEPPQVEATSVSWVIRIDGYRDVPLSSPWDGQYVQQYEPGDGSQPGVWTFRTTTSTAAAKQFPDQASADAERDRTDPLSPWRWDARPNTPLWLLKTTSISV